MLTFPAMLWSLAMFEFGNVDTACAGQSGYSHWLMRLPLSNRTLAVVPLLLRFIWITFFFSTFYLASGLLGGVWLPFWSGLLVFMAGGVWTSIISWTPCSGILSRVLLIIVPGLLYYALFASVMAVHFSNFTDIAVFREYPVPIKVLVYSITVLVFVGGFWCALGAISLARNNHNGLIPETKTKFAGWWGRFNGLLAPDASSVKLHANRRRALAWHDLRRVMLFSEKSLLILIGAFALLAMAFLPLEAANFIFSFLLLTNIGTIAGQGLLEPTKMQGSSLPTYLAASPLTCAEIGFTRAWSTIGVALGCLAFFAASYGLCLLMPYNQQRLFAWIESNNAIYGDSFAAYRWMALVALVSVAIIPTRILGFVWPTLTGRSRLAMFALIAPLLLVFGGIFVVTFWFLKQTDWESAQANAWYWASWLPTLMAVMLGVKFAGTVFAVNRCLSKRLVSVKSASVIAAVWLTATLVIATVCQWLIPDHRIAFAWTLMATALVLPLGRVMILPYSVWLNRYR
jgi:hypothetical protein